MRTRSYMVLAMMLCTAAFASGALAATTNVNASDAAPRAHDRVADATQLVHRMERNPRLARLLAHSRGVFIIPHYGSAAFIVGGRGGGGVVLAHHNGTWTGPAFFNIAGGSIGLQAGATGGAIALILMTRKGMRRFESGDGAWSFGGQAGLTVVSYSRDLRSNASGADVVVWTDKHGLYAGLKARLTRIIPDNTLDRVYYRHRANPHEILTGMATTSKVSAAQLRQALAKL